MVILISVHVGTYKPIFYVFCDLKTMCTFLQEYSSVRFHMVLAVHGGLSPIAISIHRCHWRAAAICDRKYPRAHFVSCLISCRTFLRNQTQPHES